MRERRWLLLAVYGILLVNAVSAAFKGTRPKFKIATTSTTTTSTSTTAETPVEGTENVENEQQTTMVAAAATADNTNATTGHTLTGIPQIDYIWDPNLPRELNGYNLSDYPFYNSIPEDIDFKCDGLHDGFYASVPHKCQVYHHCLFGTRYDFLCANFTAFDQKTFICHFVSEVDCANSKKYWHRNDALYKAATTSTTSTTSTTTTTTVSPMTAAPQHPAAVLPRRRRPFRRRPAYDYYDEEYYDDEYTRPRGYDRHDEYDYDDRKYRRDRDFRDRDFRDSRPRDVTLRDDRDRDRDRDTGARDRFPNRANRRDHPTLLRGRDSLEEDSRIRIRDQEQGGSRSQDETDETDIEDHRYSDKRYRDEYEERESAPTIGSAAPNTDTLVKPAAPSLSVYSRPRTPPKIRRPVPLSEQDRFAYKATSPPLQSSSLSASSPSSSSSTTPLPPPPPPPPPPPLLSNDESRRRSPDVLGDDYYEDELEEVRPRRPLRRRPTYRDRDRDFYDIRDRDRDRERDRPFRSRYRDDDDDDDNIRPTRKHSDRSRDRYYDRERNRERSRDRLLERNKDRSSERSLDRDRGRVRDSIRLEKSYMNRPITPDRDQDMERARSPLRSKDLENESPKKSAAIYDRTTEKLVTVPAMSITTLTPTTTCTPKELIEQKGDARNQFTRPDSQNTDRTNLGEQQFYKEPQHPEHSAKLTHDQDYQEKYGEGRTNEHVYQQQSTPPDDYSVEYYDELEDAQAPAPTSPPPSPPSPRTTVRIVKRPFLPSRGGNPNPRGLLPVGTRASGSYRRDEDKTTEKSTPLNTYQHKYYVQEETQEDFQESAHEQKSQLEDPKQPYDAYKVIQTDLHQKQRSDEFDTAVIKPNLRRPIERDREEDSSKLQESRIRVPVRNQDGQSESLEREAPTQKWTAEEDVTINKNYEKDLRNKGRPQLPTEPTNSYTSTYKNDNNSPNQSSGPGSLRVKQRINEVTHSLQDIPESEYDVTLNDALTPTLNQETNLPSGFVLPFHRQIGRDAILQSSENNYKISRSVNQQQQQQKQQPYQHQQSQQQQQPQPQKSFVPGPPFLSADLTNNDRARVYFRTPETIQISGTQYRQHRGPWNDYNY